MRPHAASFLSALVLFAAGVALAGEASGPREHIAVRGLYGGLPRELMEEGRTLAEAGVNAVWIGERGITAPVVRLLKSQGVQVYAEFNTLHRADYLDGHPDAAPVGPDGERAPAPHGWQGICPTHEPYRRWRMEAFEGLLREHELDGVWLDYHHAHASWERADPVLPDTCFCPRCLERFAADTGLPVEEGAAAPIASRLLGPWRDTWVAWRCGVFTDWVRRFRAIIDEIRPTARLGTFHCPWTDAERGGALRAKLAIDLASQAKYVDVFSPMPYHARFGHARDPAWIARQVAWLGRHLGIGGTADEPRRIWPIVQLADWGETVPVEQVEAVLDYATRPPATGVIVFSWGGLREHPGKVDALVRFYRAVRR